MSSSNQSDDNPEQNNNNTSTTNIFGSSTKSSISSLFGSSNILNRSDSENRSSESLPSSTTSNPVTFPSTSRDLDVSNGGDGYDLFGTTDITDTTVVGSKDMEPMKPLPVSGDSKPSGSLFSFEKPDKPLFSSSGESKSSVSFGNPVRFGSSSLDNPKTTNLFGGPTLFKATDSFSTHKDPPVLQTHVEKPKDTLQLDLSKVSQSDHGDGYDSNLYSVKDRDSDVLEKPKSEETVVFGGSETPKESSDLFKPSDKSTDGLFGSSDPKTVTTAPTTAPTFNLVDNDQTNKVSESTLSSKTASLTEPGDTKTSLFGTSKSSFFDEIPKQSSFGSDSKLTPASSETAPLLSTSDKSTNLFGVDSQSKPSLFDTQQTTDSKSGTSLFGSTTNLFGTQKSDNLFGSSSTTSLFGTTPSTNLFSSTGAASGSFGTSDKTSTSNLFGSSDTTTDKPLGSLFGTQKTDNLFGTSDKSSTSNLFSSTGTGSGLFGSTDKGATTDFGKTGTSASTNLFSSQDKQSSTNLFGSTDTAVTTPSTTLFSKSDSSAPAPLFGTSDSASGSAPNLFTKTDKPESTNLFGSSDKTGTTNLFGSTDKTTTTNLFGSTESASKTTGLATSDSKTSVFGSQQTKPTEVLPTTDTQKQKDPIPKVTFNLPTPDSTSATTQPSVTPQATPQPGFQPVQDATKLDVEFSVTEQHTIAELLESWEKRIAKKVENFNLFADKVAMIDRQIVQQCNSINNLLNMHKELLEKHKKMELSVKTMEEEQKMALSVLDNMEKVLKGKLESVNNRSNGYNMVQAITRNLQELTDQLATTTKVAEDTAEACQPEPLYTIAKVLSFHQVSLLDLEKQCDEIDNRIKAMELM